MKEELIRLIEENDINSDNTISFVAEQLVELLNSKRENDKIEHVLEWLNERII